MAFFSRFNRPWLHFIVLGFLLFYLRGVAPVSVKTSDIYRGIVPFVAIQSLALALLWFAPALATWLPKVIYG
mgnify:CR=1 FL=1